MPLPLSLVLCHQNQLIAVGRMFSSFLLEALMGDKKKENKKKNPSSFKFCNLPKTCTHVDQFLLEGYNVKVRQQQAVQNMVYFYPALLD